MRQWSATDYVDPEWYAVEEERVLPALLHQLLVIHRPKRLTWHQELGRRRWGGVGSGVGGLVDHRHDVEARLATRRVGDLDHRVVDVVVLELQGPAHHGVHHVGGRDV